MHCHACTPVVCCSQGLCTRAPIHTLSNVGVWANTQAPIESSNKKLAEGMKKTSRGGGCGASSHTLHNSSSHDSTTAAETTLERTTLNPTQTHRGMHMRR
jgi:hypothetical protein